MSGLRRILVSEEIEGVGIEQLKAKYEVSVAPTLWQNSVQLEEAVREIEALIIRNQTQVTESLLVKAKVLHVIGRAGAGYDNVNIDAASQAGVVVCYSPEENAVSVAEHVFALLLSLARKVPGGRSIRQGREMGEKKISRH